MRRLTRSLFLAATILCAAGTATACSSSLSSSISSAVASRSAGRYDQLLTRRKHELLGYRNPELPGRHELEPFGPGGNFVGALQLCRTCTCDAAKCQCDGSGERVRLRPAMAMDRHRPGRCHRGDRPDRPLGTPALLATAADWRTKVIDVYAEGSALLDAMRIADARGLVAGDGPADAQWYDIQRRVDDLARSLYALREQAPDEESRARVADVLASLQAARAAMDSERASGAASGPGEEMIRSRLAAFEASLRTLRSAYYPEG